MASAVLASQNESNWAHMGKIPYSNPHLNANPNPNPKKEQKQFHHVAAGTNGAMSVGRYHNNHKVESPVITQTASDDAYSFNQTSVSRAPSDNYGGYLTFDISSYSKPELLELRKRLSVELDQIRGCRDRLESGQFSIAGYSRSQAKFKKLPGNNKRPGVVGFESIPKQMYSGLDNGSSEIVNYDDLFKECGKILPKLTKSKYSHIFKKPVDVVGMRLLDYHQIVKRPMDLGTVKENLAKKIYPTPMEFATDVRLTFNNALLYNPKSHPVNQLAEKLLAQFEELFRPIHQKVSSYVNQRKDRDLHESRVNHDDEMPFVGIEELQGSSWSNHHQNSYILPSPMKAKRENPNGSPVPVPQVSKKPERMQQIPVQAHSSASTPSHPSAPVIQQSLRQEPPPSPVQAPPSAVKEHKVAGRGSGTVKQPKPRAKDLNKREMSMEEKQKLGMGLQNLPQEKMGQLVQIIRKRNEQLAQDGDEIELDIEALDTETLWELDRFVTNWKKFVSKSKRQALMMNNYLAGGAAAPSTPLTEADMGVISDKNDDTGRKFKENDDEDVDIDDDDDMPAMSFPPVEIEKDEIVGGAGLGQDHDQNNNVEHGNGNASSSSSSSGSSSSDSSSSDSDSGSSSGSDSDADDAQS